MTDEIQTTETKARQKPTRCYIDGGKFILRTLGQADVVVPTPDIPTGVQAALTIEMMALLLLRGETMADIAAGKGLTDRALPAGKREKSTAPRPLNAVRRAILGVRVVELKREAKAAGSKLDAVTIADLADRAESWVRGLTDDQAARLARAEAVQVEMARAKGAKGTLAELLGEPTEAAA